MTIHFEYDLEMEWDNFRRGLYSKNHPGILPKLAEEMVEKKLDYKNKKVVLDFIKKKTLALKLYPENQISKIQNDWQKIELESIKRMDMLFGQSLNYNITVYLTVNNRCAYNIDQHYFFVNMFSKSTNRIILHELLHFYTYEYILPIFKQRNLNYNQFNDYKEALTFLLNTNLGYLLNGYKDNGYKKQKDLRIYLEKTWPKYNNINILTKFTIDNYFKKAI